MVRIGGILAACAALAWAGCGKSRKSSQPGPDATAQGQVTALVGEVTAARGPASPRVLVVGAEVFADDVIRTGVGASVSIKIARAATFELGAERERALAEVIASLDSMPSTGASPEADLTAAAGRHAEAEAADTMATANAEPPKPGGGGPDDDARRKAIEDYIKRQGMLKIIGGSGSDGDGVSDGEVADALMGASSLPEVIDGKPPKGSTSTSGAVSPELIRKAMATAKNQLKFCYERELVKDPKLATKLSVRFTIGKAGTVTAAAVTSATPSAPGLEACVIAAIKKMRFPAPAGGGDVVVNYPLSFAPPQE
ncbi:MAG: AgmX/PglI C-terminal domain-containing protein [Deltaproteobacteria bacterium]|nr:AgmX/PglI C-terminal domain-containing protein [Deltaproteobacteria bacterium]